MSYTFSRRDFMKYSAVAAVAVAGSSMFTGCGSISNPNRPFAVYNAAEDSKLTFGGKSGGIFGFGGMQLLPLCKVFHKFYCNIYIILPAIL